MKAGQTVTLEFRNPPLGSLIIEKPGRVGSKTVPLSGVRLEIKYADGTYVDAAGASSSQAVFNYTDSTGKITLSGIVVTVVKDVHYRNLQQSFLILSKRKIPFGYRIQNGKPATCLQEAQAVRDIFNSYLAGASYSHIAAERRDCSGPSAFALRRIV